MSRDCEHVYMEVDLKDKELPITITDTAYEMSKITGIPVKNIYACISKVRSGERKRSRFVRVDL